MSSDTGGSEERLKSGVSDNWQKCFSSTHKQDYWFNSSTGSTSWVDPSIAESSLKKRRIEESQKSDEKHLSSSNATKSSYSTSEKTAVQSTKMQPEIAIIVPYRDLHKEQHRKQQLDVFIPSISKFMELNKDRSSYRIYIIEQSNDERKFNRGKLLNIGFKIACADGCKALIFHDVDLLPSPDLNEFYYKIPNEKPIHIARVWDRYSVNADYFGGITSFSESQFRQINGFPNNFWGWGGEDDELKKRTEKVGLTSTFPTSGKITDMEDMNLKNKLDFLREHKVWKCMNKTEVLEEHSSSWMQNGLNSLKYEELYRTEVSKTAVIITVDVSLNSHWTDLVCGVTDTQLTESVKSLKARFK